VPRSFVESTFESILKMFLFLFPFFADSLMGSASEDEDEDDPIRPPLNLGPLGPNGPESVGPLGASDLSVQSMSTDSKNGVDDSDQVILFGMPSSSLSHVSLCLFLSLSLSLGSPVVTPSGLFGR
jgi:hypothetical protein